jgi:hypothetical protein
MTQRTDARLITGALSMVRLSTWGLHGNAVELVRLLTVDAGAEWAEVSRHDVADWLDTSPRHARRIMLELVDRRVLDRRPHAGVRPAGYRFRDPRDWRGVPWRFRDRDTAPDERPPELVLRRLDACVTPEPAVDRALVGRFDAWRRPTSEIVVRSQVAPRANKISYLRAAGAQLEPTYLAADPACGGQLGADGPSSTSREPTGSAVARDEDQKTEEAGSAGRGDRTLTGAAEEVRKAIVRTGTGPVKGKLLARLDDGFRHVSVDLLGPVLGAIARAGADGQRPPALVDMAVDMIDAGAASVAPTITGKKPEVVLAELYDQEQVLKRDLADAEAEGSDVADIFRRQLDACQDRIAQITGEEATG